MCLSYVLCRRKAEKTRRASSRWCGPDVIFALRCKELRSQLYGDQGKESLGGGEGTERAQAWLAQYAVILGELGVTNCSWWAGKGVP